MVLNLCFDRKDSFKSRIISLNEEFVSKVDDFMRNNETEDVTLFFDNLIKEINTIILLVQWKLDEKNEATVRLKYDLISLCCTSLIDFYCQKEQKGGNLHTSEIEQCVHTCFYFLQGYSDYILDVLLYSEKVTKRNKPLIQLYFKKLISHVKSAEVTEIGFLKIFVLYHWYLHIFGIDGYETELKSFIIKTGLPSDLATWFESNGLQFESKNVHEMLKNYSFKDCSQWLDIFAKGKQDSIEKHSTSDEDNIFQFFVDKTADDNTAPLSSDQTELDIQFVDTESQLIETSEKFDETSTSAIFEPFLHDENNDGPITDDLDAHKSFETVVIDTENSNIGQYNVAKEENPVSSPLIDHPSPQPDQTASKLDTILAENESNKSPNKRKREKSGSEKIPSPKIDEKVPIADFDPEKADIEALESEKHDRFDSDLIVKTNNRVLRQRKSESLSPESQNCPKTPVVSKRKKSNSASASTPVPTSRRTTAKKQSAIVENVGSDKANPSPNDGPVAPPRYLTRSQTKRKL